MTDLERIVVDLIEHGRARCGAGFGKYPFGILYAVEQLLPLVAGSTTVQERLAAFKKRLEE